LGWHTTELTTGHRRLTLRDTLSLMISNQLLQLSHKLTERFKVGRIALDEYLHNLL
jgi:hypothetical protein